MRIANDSTYGLSGGVVSADLDRAMGVAERIRTGTMSVNSGIYYGPDALRGYKTSGVGRQCGIEGLEEFLETKTIAIPA